MAQWRSTAFTEYAPDSPNEKWGPGSTHFIRQLDLFDGTFRGRTQAAYDILGYGVVVATKDVNFPYYIHRVTPMPAPAIDPTLVVVDPGSKLIPEFVPPDLRQRLYAVGISRTEPLGVPSGVDRGAVPLNTAASSYARARLTVEYATLPYQIKEDSSVTNVSGYPAEGQILQDLGWNSTRYIARHIQPFNRLLKIPYGVMWTNGKNTKVGIPYREGGANITYRWMVVPLDVGPVPGVNLGRIGRLEGTINSQSFDGFAAGTLLFDTFSTREYQGSFGERLMDVTFQMIYLPHPSTGKSGNFDQGTQLGWNYIYDIVNGKNDYYKVSADQAGNNLPYQTDPTYTFADLFRP